MSAIPKNAADAPLVLREQVGPVVTLTLNRPAQFNALSEALLEVLTEQLSSIARDSSVRVVVLAAADKAFCAGHDLREMRADPSLDYYQELFADPNHVDRVYSVNTVTAVSNDGGAS